MRCGDGIHGPLDGAGLPIELAVVYYLSLFCVVLISKVVYGNILYLS